MKTILALIAKEYRLFWSDKVAVSLTFIIPILLIMIWGSIFGNVGSGPRSLRLAFLNQSTAPVARKIETVLDTTKTFLLVKSFKDERGNTVNFDTTTIRDYVRKGSAPAALVIPADAFTDTSSGLKLKLYYDPKNDMEIQLIRGVLRQTIMSQIPSVFVQSMQRQALQFLGADSGLAFNDAIASVVGEYFDIDPGRVKMPIPNDTVFNIGADGEGGSAFFGSLVAFDEEQLVGKEIANPWATRSVGGWAIMFLMFTLTASASSLFDEKKSGVVLRILASPVSRVNILWSKYVFNMSLGFLQLIVLFGAGAVLFSIDIFSNFGNLLLIVAAAAAACTSFGMLLAAVSKTSAQANGLGTFLILAMSSIGGAWFPTSFMPDFIQTISKGTIVYWAMDGFLQVLWRGLGTVDILDNLGILFGIAALITAFSVWRFKKGHVF